MLEQNEDGWHSSRWKVAAIASYCSWLVGCRPTHTWEASLPGMLLLPSDRLHDKVPLGSSEGLTTCTGHM